MAALSLLLGLFVSNPRQLLQDSRVDQGDGQVRRSITALRADPPPRIDGVLDDEIWGRGVPVSGFRRDDPNDGEPAAERTEVRIAYDDDALYVGARMYDSRPEAISRRLDRRDTFERFNDQFYLVIDSYRDRRTAFILGVTPAGGRNDGIAPNDSKETIDDSWDPVWEARTSIDELGWVAEMRIPFSQLRFADGEEQVWGVLLFRDIFRAGEGTSWPWLSEAESGWTSRFPDLILGDIPAPRRLEVLPYTVSQGTFTQGADAGNPFGGVSRYRLSGGADIKYGLSTDFTLDLTLNPDFGQVDADPAEVNLTVYETVFPELRPFFVEGRRFFNFGVGGHSLFYSRRVGRSPSRSVIGAAHYVDEPVATTILGAAKVSGRTQSGWTLGVLDAVTGRESARMATAGGTRLPNEPLEPLTNYAVVRARKDFRQGSSQVGAFASTVHRDLADPSLHFLTRSAYSGGVDFLHRFARNAYSLTGVYAFSHVRGEPLALLAVQRNSARYFQRPDQDHLTLDPTRTSLSGALVLMDLSETAGNWTFGVGSGFSTPGFEINDAGIQSKVDNIVAYGGVGRRWLEPGKMFRSAQVNADVSTSMNFGGTVLAWNVDTRFLGRFHNFWGVDASARMSFEGLSDRATRGGPLMEVPASWGAGAGVETDTRSTVSARGSINVTSQRQGTWSVRASPALEVRGGTLAFSLSPSYARSHADAFYVTQLVDPLAQATYGGRYVFAGLDRSALDITLRADWAITRNLTLQFYGQPFIDAGDYESFKEFAAPSGYDFVEYGVDGGSTSSYDEVNNRFTVDADGAGPGASITFRNPDYTVRALRTNMVLRWEYHPGSTLFVAWSQNRFFRAPDPSFRAFRELGELFGDDQQNVVLIKVNYWMGY